jgi:hypothetical protein
MKGLIAPLVETPDILIHVHPRDTTLDGHEAQLRVYRRLGATGRARLAERLSVDTRRLTRSGIRTRHPEYTDEQIELALRRILLGDELFRRAWPTSALLSP